MTLGLIPMLSALATFGALLASILIAKQARSQAHESEAARLASEAARLESNRKQRFVDAISSFLNAIPEYLDARKAYEQEMQVYKVNGPFSGGRVSTAPFAPSSSALIARLATAELNASAAEGLLVEHVRNVVLLDGSVDEYARRRRIASLPALVVHWNRGQDLDKERVITTLADLSHTKDSESIVAILERYQRSQASAPDSVE
ncbi:hypothetical protein [Arthrobacter sp. NPDC092385]|uniref:hypothetical protein n=1 Tax=Arthrobacter sp. NPDC092385 TaxID=3363943 RepID=UPI00380BE0C9